MDIRNIRHKGLRNYVVKNNPKGLSQDYIEKITDIMTFLIEIEDIEEVMDLKKYNPHRLTGERAGTFSFYVTANWRITFRFDDVENEIYNVDFEDYH